METFALRRTSNAPYDMVLTLQARAAEGASRLTRFRVSWDGGWEDGEVEMAQHFSVTQVSV